MTVLLALGATAGAEEVRVERNLSYTEPAGVGRQLDIYWRPARSGCPVVVRLHGGGWRSGDKSGVQQKPDGCVGRGFVFVSVNYRFVPDVTVGDMVGDVAAAVKWVHDRVGEYGGSSDRIVVSGHSAGAHLAALICTDGRYLAKQGMSLAEVQACFPVDTAAYDVPAQVESMGPVRRPTYTSAFGEEEQRQREYSPIAYVAEGRKYPRFMILHVADRYDSRQQSLALASALESAGGTAQVFAAMGKNHETINRDLGRPDDPATLAIFQFRAFLRPIPH
ncbi:MAG: alpha/beta hydrolase [Pirellulaceae bacterium]